MKLSHFRILLAAQLLLIMATQNLFSQTIGVVADVVTRKPVPYVSIYTKTSESVLGAMSNEQGQFSINFAFNILFLSHINYEKIELNKTSIHDTIFLTPSTVLLNEVVVNNRQPLWINSVLTRVIKNKGRNYQTLSKTLSYDYETYTLTDSNGYSFKSHGNILFPVLKRKALYKMSAHSNTIKYKDKSAGVDFSNLRRMLYDDFISHFDAGFIKDYDFKLNSSYISHDNNIIQLLFSSKKFRDDEGFIIVDTLNNVIIEAEKNSGTEFNIHNQTTSILRKAASSRGFTYNTWITKTNTLYKKVGQSYYPCECKYKFYIKTTTNTKNQSVNYFTSIESKLSFDAKIDRESNELITIPQPYYIVAIQSKRKRLAEEALNKVPVTFEKF